MSGRWSNCAAKVYPWFCFTEIFPNLTLYSLHYNPRSSGGCGSPQFSEMRLFSFFNPAGGCGAGVLQVRSPDQLQKHSLGVY